ncbi:hypothetical protein DFJ74DRAFT_695950 [Hyaloraphidium curvatum]|nr:hypothetical protein DFJ74DRAFT_695950 [Hyaloraphidium curvatum]
MDTKDRHVSGMGGCLMGFGIPQDCYEPMKAFHTRFWPLLSCCLFALWQCASISRPVRKRLALDPAFLDALGVLPLHDFDLLTLLVLANGDVPPPASSGRESVRPHPDDGPLFTPGEPMVRISGRVLLHSPEARAAADRARQGSFSAYRTLLACLLEEHLPYEERMDWLEAERCAMCMPSWLRWFYDDRWDGRTSPFVGAPRDVLVLDAELRQLADAIGIAAGGSKPRALPFADPLPGAGPDSCDACGKSGGLMRCGRCLVARYCSARCQKRAWGELGHKAGCVKSELERASFLDRASDDEAGHGEGREKGEEDA